MLPVCRWIRVGGRNESIMYLCVKKIAMAGGKTARMNSLARATGTQDGIGVQACTKAHGYPCNSLLLDDTHAYFNLATSLQYTYNDTLLNPKNTEKYNIYPQH